MEFIVGFGVPKSEPERLMFLSVFLRSLLFWNISLEVFEMLHLVRI